MAAASPVGPPVVNETICGWCGWRDVLEGAQHLTEQGLAVCTAIHRTWIARIGARLAHSSCEFFVSILMVVDRGWMKIQEDFEGKAHRICAIVETAEETLQIRKKSPIPTVPTPLSHSVPIHVKHNVVEGQRVIPIAR